MGVFKNIMGTMSNVFKLGPESNASIKNIDGRITAANSDEAYREIAMQDITGNDTGFPYSEWNSSTGFTFNLETKLFSVVPVSNSFCFYVRGVRIVKTVAQSITVPDATGRYFVYFDISGNLQYSVSTWEINSSIAPVAVIYYNKTKNQYKIFDERHTSSRNVAWHAWAHKNIGALYGNGLVLSGYALDSDDDLDIELDITDGEIWDEDLRIPITHSSNPIQEFEQILAKPAKLPVVYREGGGDWVWDDATNFFVKNTTNGRVNYNKWNGTSWIQQEANDTNYIAYWIIATNNYLPGESIISIQGQRQDNKLQDAIDNNSIQTLSLGLIPSQEFKILYKVIVQTRNNFGGTRKFKIQHIEDLRSVQNAGDGDYKTFSHSSLGGLNSSGHPASTILNEIDAFNNVLSATEDNVQKALDKIDEFLGTIIKPIKIDINLSNVSSSYVLPENALVRSADLKIVTAYSSGTTIEVKTGGSNPLTLLETSEISPTITGVHSKIKMQNITSDNSGIINVIVNGEPSVGNAILLIFVVEKFAS